MKNLHKFCTMAFPLLVAAWLVAELDQFIDVAQYKWFLDVAAIICGSVSLLDWTIIRHISARYR